MDELCRKKLVLLLSQIEDLQISEELCEMTEEQFLDRITDLTSRVAQNFTILDSSQFTADKWQEKLNLRVQSYLQRSKMRPSWVLPEYIRERWHYRGSILAELVAVVDRTL